MKGHLKFKLLLFMAVLATAFFSFCDVNACNSVMHFANNVSVDHVMMATVAIVSIPSISNYVKDNCTITADQINDLKAKYGKIKILTVIIEPPVYDDNGKLIDKGEFYSFAVRRPDPGIVRMLMEFAEKGETEKYVEAAIKNLVVGGDLDVLKTDGLVYMGITTQLKDLIKPYNSFLANA